MNLNCDIVHRSMNRITMDLHLWHYRDDESDLLRRKRFETCESQALYVYNRTSFLVRDLRLALLFFQLENRKLSHFLPSPPLIHVTKYTLAAIFCVTFSALSWAMLMQRARKRRIAHRIQNV